MQINEEAFSKAHQKFVAFIGQHQDAPFVSFQDPAFLEMEIYYKTAVYHNARDKLQLEKWPRWLEKQPDQILKRLQAITDKRVSRNLLEHRFGPPTSLHKATAPQVIRELARRFHDFFQTAKSSREEFATAFDKLAHYLRTKRLGCRWEFISYLAFIANCREYFPIRPTKFENLLQYYGINENIARHVSWERYALLLELAETVKEKLGLMGYGQLHTLYIQSYMFTISHLLETGWEKPDPYDTTIDPQQELKKRKDAAQIREEYGFQGEEFIYRREREKLKQAGRCDLADQVEWVAITKSEKGYDIRSFQPNGEEIHIEVKSTIQSRSSDRGFWLTDVEKDTADQDPSWQLIRVWEVNTSPHYEVLGNIIRSPSDSWEMKPDIWLIRPRKDGPTEDANH